MSPVVLPGLSFTAIDFETANPKRASVCAVGVVKVRDGVVVDLSVFHQASQSYGIHVPPATWLCTHQVSKSVLDLASYRLPDVSAALRLPPHAHHDAGADAHQCAQVLVALCRQIGPRGLEVLREHARLS